MDGVTTGHEEAWTVPAPAPGTTCLTAGPEEITLRRHQGDQEEGPGARTMRAAAGGEEGGEEAEVGLTSLPATQSTSLDRNQEHGRMIATLTRVLVVAPASSSEPSGPATSVSENMHTSLELGALLSGYW